MTRDERERALVLALYQIEALCDFRVVATGAEIDHLLAAIDAVAWRSRMLARSRSYREVSGQKGTAARLSRRAALLVFKIARGLAALISHYWTVRFSISCPACGRHRIDAAYGPAVPHGGHRIRRARRPPSRRWPRSRGCPEARCN
jgi:hypothetical protein